jgi:hypothetical protein
MGQIGLDTLYVRIFWAHDGQDGCRVFEVVVDPREDC